MERSAGHYPEEYEGRLGLRNGKEVFLRPVRETDGPLLAGLFGRLSPESVYRRFLGHLASLQDGMLEHFTRLDYDREFALAAVVMEAGAEAVIGVGRYAWDAKEGVTDLAVAVRDDWQGLGLGSHLLARTIDAAREHGITAFRSLMDPGNAAIRHILLRLGLRVKYTPRSGLFRVEILA